MNRPWQDLLYPEETGAIGKAEPSGCDVEANQTMVGGLSSGFRSDFWLRGYRMIEQMTGEISFVQGLVLALTGRLVTSKEDRLLNGMFINNAIADARFWLFRTSRLAATVKAPPSACISAGILVNDGSFLASGAAYHTAAFFYQARKRLLREQISLKQIVEEQLAQGEIIGGFGRVLARGPDERNPSLLQLAEDCGLAKGPHLQQAYEIEILLQKLKDDRLFMNSAGLIISLMLDMKFTPQEIMLLTSFMFVIGMSGNIIEAYERPPGEFQRLTDKDITYTGPPRRSPPDSAPDQQQVIQIVKGTRVVIMDSVSYLTTENPGDIIVCGSHGGVPAATYVQDFSPRAIFFSDAGKGKEDAGIGGLSLLDDNNIIALAVSVASARIGDAMDIYRNGIITATNRTAQAEGLANSMKVTEAIDKLLNL